MRFGDGWNWIVLLDGNDVSDVCTEAQAGESGWVNVYERPNVRCALMGLHQRRLIGRVQIMRGAAGLQP